MSARETILRLAGREYLPFAGWIATWALIALVASPAAAARLLAATMLVRGVRALTALDTGAAMRRRHGAPPEVLRKSLRRAARIEALSLLVAFVALAGVVAALYALEPARQAWWMTALVAVGLPARNFAPAGGGRRRGGLFRLALAWAGLVLVAAAELGGAGLVGIALAMGLREWIALGAVLAAPPPPDPSPRPEAEPLHWREVAAITVVRARHRLTYRVGKGLLGAVLGPFGGIVARTGRGVGMHRRFDRLAPKSPRPIALMAFATLAASVGLLIALAKPLILVVAASLFRISAAATSVLIWWRFADNGLAVDDEDDDED